MSADINQTHASRAASSVKAARLDRSDRTITERALKDLVEVAQELLATGVEKIDPAMDLTRTDDIYQRIQDATLALRRESAWLRAIAVRNALAAKLSYSIVGEALGGVGRQRVNQIANADKPTYKPSQVMRGSWLEVRRAGRDVTTHAPSRNGAAKVSGQPAGKPAARKAKAETA